MQKARSHPAIKTLAFKRVSLIAEKAILILNTQFIQVKKNHLFNCLLIICSLLNSVPLKRIQAF